MSLDAHLVVRRGTFTVDVAFAVADGEVLGLLGPNGAGKTTALRALAGLEPLTDGHVTLDGEDLGRRAPEDRNVGVVFQDYLLFPHLTALDNVAYGLRAGGMRRAAARTEAAGWLEQVGLADHAGHRPRQLSGGQAQRVALARALAYRPRLLLLDEPLAALDAGTRLTLRTDLRRHLTSYGGPAVVVTHDAVEAMVLTDHLIVLEGGRIVQSGRPAEVARRPRTDYVARLLGLNLYRGTARGDRVELDGGGGELVLADRTTGEVHVALRPSAVVLHRTYPERSSPRNVWAGRVSGVEAVGDRVRVAVTGKPDVLADVTTDAVAELDLTAGAEIWVSAKATELNVYPV
ncbi:MAG TPA: ABC transporter ATP-binding protein [Mycobacteriales bacterium]|nr:ABC transporter ATP-binding protein [Mycobacteriales bacterium]